MLEGDIGYILIKSFAINGAREFQDARMELIRAGAKSLIIDLRDNAGGVVNTAIEIANQFISTGDILHLKQKGEIFETISARSSIVGNLETVVLVNEYSASSSEILAGALQDNNAATLVGVTTYGKGAAQLMAYTNERQPYRLSIYYFLTPDKNDIHGIGITPDHIVRNSLGERREEAAELYKTFAPFVENTKPKAGDTGLNVFAAQQRLALLGYSPGITATMDDAMVAAIKAFQQEQGLYAYGELDFTTMRKIQEVTLAYVNNDSTEDLQLKKAIELLK
jgi:carboxyl-terminal processing protease